MTPKEKAIELCEKMLNGFQFTIDEYTAKQCALIAVDELINYSEEWDDDDFWQEVKQEIEKL
jgi:hypothetical protein